jgi:uncharacterized protein YndB with AHSA1/START domain
LGGAHTHRMGSEEGGFTLHVEKVLHAPTERVFAACVDPEQLAKWWGPTGFTVPRAELSVRPGGAYRITMKPPEGEPFHIAGVFRDIEPPRRLVYTFEYEEPDPDDQVTVVTLSFVGDGDATRLALEQSPFSTKDRLDLHETGWTQTLDRLDRFLA